MVIPGPPLSCITPGPETAPRLAALAALVFESPNPWNVSAFEALGSGTAECLADAEMRCALLILRVAADEAEILDVAVVPRARRRGLGTALLRQAATAAHFHGASTLFLEVAEDNCAARGLYTKAGFAEIGRRRGYYPRPCGSRMDALILSKPL